MLEKIEGFIIKSQDYGETNKIITLFSKKYGKFSAMARGSKKMKSRMAAVTQPFIHGEFLIYMNQKGLSTIQQGGVLDSLRSIREDIIKTTYAAYISELIDKLMDTHHPDYYLYDQFLQTMKWISEERDVEIAIMMLELKLFKKGGFAPIVDQCVHCGKQDHLISFSIAEGGLHCNQCTLYDDRSITLPSSVAKLLHIFAEAGLERIGKISIKPENIQLLRQVLDAYYDQYGGYYLKSRRVLKQLKLLE